jgi:hypothetical protein
LFKKAFSFILSGILLSAFFGAQTADAKTVGAARQAAEAKSKVQKMGVGADARVEVRLRDDSKVKGYVSASDEETFSVTDSKTGESRKIYYTDVSKLSKSGGSSTRRNILIGAAVAAGVVVAIIFAREALCDGGAQSRGFC